MSRPSIPTVVFQMIVAILAASTCFATVELVDHSVPETMEIGTEVTVAVTLRNGGSEPWEPDRGFKLSYHWLTEDELVVEWDGLRTELPAVVAPGEVVELAARVAAPSDPGEYAIRWDVVHEGVRWLSDDVPTPLIPVTAHAPYAMSVVRGGRPRWLSPGTLSVHRLLLRNDGTRSWEPGDGLALSYHWVGPEGETVVWDGVRTWIPTRVEPGGVVWLDARIESPDRIGRLWLRWDMVREGVAWFSQRDPTPQRARMVIVAESPLAGPAGWALISLSLALLTIAVAARPGSGWLLEIVAVGDVAWCVGVVLVKQAVVLEGLDQPITAHGVVLTVAGLALILLPSMALPRRVRAWVCWTVAAAATALLYANAVFGRFFGDLLSVAVLGATGQMDDVGASISSLLAVDDLWFWIDLAAGMVVVAAVARFPADRGRRAARLVALALVVVLAAGLWTSVAFARTGVSLFSQMFRGVLVAREIGVLNFHVVDVARAVTRSVWRPAPTDAEVERLTQWFRERAPLRSGEGPWFGSARGANLLVVQAESLQAFVIDLEVGGQEVTPFLNRWIRSAMLFEAVTDQTAQGRSSDSELATQVSLLPPPAGAAAFRFAGNDFTGMAELLESRGYHTLSAVAYEGSFWNRQRTHSAYGFSTSLFDVDFGTGEFIGWGLNDRDFFTQSVDRLAAGPEPFYAYLLTLSLHHPFEGFPDHLKEMSLGALEGTPVGNYLHTMRFFDRAFAELNSRLDETGLGEQTVVALWGDHDAGLEWTAELAELAGFRHTPAGWYLSQRVPFAIRAPGTVGFAGSSDVPAGHQDVAPTLLPLLGVDPGPYAFVGRNLLGNPGPGPVVGEYQCWMEDNHLFLQGDGTLAGGQCFTLPDLETVDVTECAEGFENATAQIRASQMVLEHDLQQELHQRLIE